MSKYNTNWASKRYTITLSGKLANTITRALLNESANDDGTYTKAYHQFCAKLDKQGFWDSPAEK